MDDKEVQVSVFNRTSTLPFSPDPTGDLLFNGLHNRLPGKMWQRVCKATEVG